MRKDISGVGARKYEAKEGYVTEGVKWKRQK